MARRNVKKSTTPESDTPTYEPKSGTVYVMRGEERVEINKALAIIQNLIDVPSSNRSARYIIKKYRTPPADHGLIRNNYYARRFGKHGV